MIMHVLYLVLLTFVRSAATDFPFVDNVAGVFAQLLEGPSLDVTTHSSVVELSSTVPQSASKPLLIIVASDRGDNAHTKSYIEVMIVLKALNQGFDGIDVVVTHAATSSHSSKLCDSVTRLFPHVKCAGASAVWPIESSLIQGRRSVLVLNTAFATKERTTTTHRGGQRRRLSVAALHGDGTFDPSLATALLSSALEWERIDDASGLITVSSGGRAVWGVKLDKRATAAHSLQKKYFAACSIALFDGSISDLSGLVAHGLACIDPVREAARAGGAAVNDALFALVGPNSTSPIDVAVSMIDEQDCDARDHESFPTLIRVAIRPNTKIVRVDATWMQHRPPLYAPLPSDSDSDSDSDAQAFVVGVPCDAVNNPQSITWAWDRWGSGCITHAASGRHFSASGDKSVWPYVALSRLHEKNAWKCRAPSLCVPAEGVETLDGLSENAREGKDCSDMRFMMRSDGKMMNLIRKTSCLGLDLSDGRLKTIANTCASAAGSNIWTYDASEGTISTNLPSKTASITTTKWCLAQEERFARFIEISAEALGTVSQMVADRCRETHNVAAYEAFAANLKKIASVAVANKPLYIVSAGTFSTHAYGARCIERFAALFPLTPLDVLPMGVSSRHLWSDASTAMSPWLCNRWVFTTNDDGNAAPLTATTSGRLIATDSSEGSYPTKLCLTRIAPLSAPTTQTLRSKRTPVHPIVLAKVCSTDENVDQLWRWDQKTGTLRPGSGAYGGCLTLPPLCQEAVHSAAVMKECTASPDQIFLGITREASVADNDEIMSHNKPPACERLTVPAFMALDAARMRAAIAAGPSAQSTFQAKHHIDDALTGPYRSFADVYDPAPLGYLDWLHRSEKRRNTARFVAINDIFTVESKEHSWDEGMGPKHVFSWSLFLPRVPHNAPDEKEMTASIQSSPLEIEVHEAGDPRATDRERYGPEIGQDGPFGQKEATTPRNAAEAHTGTLYHGTSFYKTYAQPMLDMIAHVEKDLGHKGWGIVIHLGKSLEWLRPTLLAQGKIVEVSVMKVDGIRTAGSMWRWLPFDDVRFETVLALDSDQTPSNSQAFKLWVAVQAFANDEPPTTGASMMRWLRGWKELVETNAHIGGDKCECTPPVLYEYDLPLSTVYCIIVDCGSRSSRV